MEENEWESIENSIKALTITPAARELIIVPIEGFDEMSPKDRLEYRYSQMQDDIQNVLEFIRSTTDTSLRDHFKVQLHKMLYAASILKSSIDFAFK